MTKYNVVLDVWHQMPETVVTALQGEINSRFLEITITDKGSFFNLTGKTVMVYMTKPDGKIIFNSCSVVDAPNGKINVPLTSQMSIVAGTIKDFEIHIIGSDKTRLKITGVCLKIKETANADEAIESTNEFTALIEALNKADGSLEYVEQFLKDKEQEIDALKQSAETLIEQIKAEGSQTIQGVTENFNTAMTGFNQEIDAAVKKAEDAAGKSEEIAHQAAIDTISSQKNKANGIAGLNASGKLQQMPTAADVGAVPTSRTINGKALTGNITITAEDIGTSAIFLAANPVGAIYLSVNPTNPGTLYGGTWVAWGSGCVPVGVNASDTDFKTVEKTGGAKTHTLTVQEIPPHEHDLNAVNEGVDNPNGGYHPGWTFNKQYTAQVMSASTGGGQAHNNLQPYITCYMWKRTA
ncbi:MAG: BppU family phage baseplate upper protein [Clostridiales bacterium]|nr:BppU family phage baseplate upper protein [Clostridiales bacterium]